MNEDPMKQEINKEQMYLQIIFDKNAQILLMKEELEKLMNELQEIQEKNKVEE
jgi:hypothetical protein